MAQHTLKMLHQHAVHTWVFTKHPEIIVPTNNVAGRQDIQWNHPLLKANLCLLRQTEF